MHMHNARSFSVCHGIFINCRQRPSSIYSGTFNGGYEQGIGHGSSVAKHLGKTPATDRPRFRAIRSVLSDAALEGRVNYRSGHGLVSKSKTKWGCYAFSDDKDLEVVRSELNAESYADWSLPQLIQGMPLASTTSNMTQKKLVLETARFFWDETAKRYGPGMVHIFELQRYMEAKVPPWIMTSFLPDPATDSAAANRTAQVGDKDRLIEKLDSSEKDESTGLPDFCHGGPHEEALVDALDKDVAAGLAKNWLNELSLVRAEIFCMRYHCEYTLVKIAEKLTLSSHQYVHENYKACIHLLGNFCSRQEGLSSPDLDIAFARLFFGQLRDVCTNDVLKGGCE